jgi:hypothetical protein
MIKLLKMFMNISRSVKFDNIGCHVSGCHLLVTDKQFVSRYEYDLFKQQRRLRKRAIGYPLRNLTGIKP